MHREPSSARAHEPGEHAGDDRPARLRGEPCALPRRRPGGPRGDDPGAEAHGAAHQAGARAARGDGAATGSGLSSSGRRALLRLLRRYAAAHLRDEAVAVRIAALVATHDDCLLRTATPGHLTASAWIVAADRRRHLLLLHGKLRRWLQPGGHVDGDPLPHRAALREAREETGLSSLRLWTPPAPAAPVVARGEHADHDGDPAFDAETWPLPFDLDVHPIPARGDEPAHDHHDLRYLLLADADEPLRCSDESAALRWCDAGEVAALTQEESVLRMLRKARAALAGPAAGP